MATYMDQVLSGSDGSWDKLLADIAVTRPGKDLRAKLSIAIDALGKAANNLKYREATGVGSVVTFNEETGRLSVR